jgi:hypothetical protein
MFEDGTEQWSIRPSFALEVSGDEAKYKQTHCCGVVFSYNLGTENF